MASTAAARPPQLNAVQHNTFDQLLAVGAERPVARPGLAEDLRQFLSDGVTPALRRWTEPTLWLSKGQVFSVLRCEGGFLANRDQPHTGHTNPTVAVGLVSHRAIQLAHTHPGLPVDELVSAAVTGACSEEQFKTFWDDADASTQSDVLVAATSKVMGYLDSWPPLHPTWSPRFEEPIQAKVGKLTLSGRVDLLLGRPRADGKQTMVIADWKSGSLNDDHAAEAGFYALLSTLRFGIPPYRSTIFSLASGAWTEPDVTEEVLFTAAETVVFAVEAIVDTLTETRAPALKPSPACNWCPAANTCPALAQKVA